MSTSAGKPRRDRLLRVLQAMVLLSALAIVSVLFLPQRPRPASTGDRLQEPVPSQPAPAQRSAPPVEQREPSQPGLPQVGSQAQAWQGWQQALPQQLQAQQRAGEQSQSMGEQLPGDQISASGQAFPGPATVGPGAQPALPQPQAGGALPGPHACLICDAATGTVKLGPGAGGACSCSDPEFAAQIGAPMCCNIGNVPPDAKCIHYQRWVARGGDPSYGGGVSEEILEQIQQGSSNLLGGAIPPPSTR